MNNLANHLELEPTASWTSLGMPGPPKCQELRRKDGVSKRFPGPAKSDQWISEKNTIQNRFFPKPASDSIRAGLPAGVQTP